MSKKASRSDFRSNLADSKSGDMSAIHGSSILHHTQPKYSISSSRGCRKVPSKLDAREGASCGPASKPFSFTKVLLSKDASHTSECCRICIPRVFCVKHNVESNMTLTDSTGHRLWHIRFQLCDFSKHKRYVVSNGWREFSYDHSLKIGDSLVFTLISISHFIVEFATSSGSTRAMLPTRDGKDYPWKINHSRLNCLSFADIQGGKKGIQENVAVYSKYSASKDDDLDQEEYADNGPTSTPRSFTKTISLKCGIHTTRLCRLLLPAAFCKKHNVKRNVTMTNSARQKQWHMRLQSCGSESSSRRSIYAISNGWREFAYDHNLKANDKLVFTLVSTSHFVVEFATSNGSTRAMLPTRDGEDYPWRTNYARLECLPIADQVQRAKKVASIVLRHKQKAEKEMFCQCDIAEVGNGMNTRKEYVLPELTHLECKNADGSSYLQIVDSDNDSEMTSLDHED